MQNNKSINPSETNNKSNTSNMEESPLFVELEVKDAIFTATGVESMNTTNTNLVLDENEQFSRSLQTDDSTSNYMFYSTRMMPTVNTDEVVSFSTPAPGTPAAEALAGNIYLFIYYFNIIN